MDRLFFQRRLFTDKSLVAFLCKSVKERVQRNHIFSTAFTFYTMTLMSFLNEIRHVDDDLVLLLLPYISHGIGSKFKVNICHL
jgi:hypothetical protein